jgi:hypothetical protein
MSKFDQFPRLPSQIQRIAMRAEARAIERPAVTPALRNEAAIVTPRDETPKRGGRPKVFASPAERQKAYRARKRG